MILRSPLLLICLMILSLAPVGFAAATQTDQASYDPLDAFVGTWTAKTAGESAPYLSLTFKKDNGRLIGTTTHFKIRLIRGAEITGSPLGAEETPLGDIKVFGSDLSFTWDAESYLRAVPAKFVVQGTQQALLVLMLSPEELQAVMKNNRGATGFSPAIPLRRETETAGKLRTSTENWQPTLMARLINTAEAQYKSKNGRYADFHTLVHSGQLKETNGQEFKMAPGNLESETDPLPGYQLRFSMSPDADSYQVFIRKPIADCGLGVFTDESGLVFEGRDAGCSQASK